MLYLPRGISAYIANLALERQTDQGSLMIDIVSKWCWEQGFTCNHPAYAQKLHKGAKPSINQRPLFRCLICGQIFQKGAEK